MPRAKRRPRGPAVSRGASPEGRERRPCTRPERRYGGAGGLWGPPLLVGRILAVTIDNVIRPVLIRKGADLPLVMIFAGVIGGLVAFGILGIFIGPVVLAVPSARLH